MDDGFAGLSGGSLAEDRLLQLRVGSGPLSVLLDFQDPRGEEPEVPTQASAHLRYPARDALRGAVDAAHERLHRAPAFAAITAGSIHRRDYIDLLKRLLRFHAATAPALRQGHHVLGTVAVHDRAPLIRADLESLGSDSAEEQLCHEILTDDEAVGLVYAVEGSSLGGLVINRQLDAIFGNEEAGRSFFACRPEPKRRWHLVCAALERHGASPERLEAMCRGARLTFALMEDCLGS